MHEHLLQRVLSDGELGDKVLDLQLALQGPEGAQEGEVLSCHFIQNTILLLLDQACRLKRLQDNLIDRRFRDSHLFVDKQPVPTAVLLLQVLHRSHAHKASVDHNPYLVAQGFCLC